MSTGSGGALHAASFPRRNQGKQIMMGAGTDIGVGGKNDDIAAPNTPATDS
jgi:hypothetical protein